MIVSGARECPCELADFLGEPKECAVTSTGRVAIVVDRFDELLELFDSHDLAKYSTIGWRVNVILSVGGLERPGSGPGGVTGGLEDSWSEAVRE